MRGCRSETSAIPGYGARKAAKAGADVRRKMLSLQTEVGGAQGVALETWSHALFSVVFGEALSGIYAFRPGWAATIHDEELSMGRVG